jgi:hypothetical protein
MKRVHINNVLAMAVGDTPCVLARSGLGSFRVLRADHGERHLVGSGPPAPFHSITNRAVYTQGGVGWFWVPGL